MPGSFGEKCGSAAQGAPKALLFFFKVLWFSIFNMFGRYQMKGLEEQEVMKREEEENFHHIETDTEYIFFGI